MNVKKTPYFPYDYKNNIKKSQKIRNNIKIKILINSEIRPSREANRRPIHQAATKIFMYWNNGRGFRLCIDTSTKYYVNNTPLLGIKEFRSNASFIMIFAAERNIRYFTNTVWFKLRWFLFRWHQRLNPMRNRNMRKIPKRELII